MPRVLRGGLRTILAAGGQKSVSRFIAQGAGPMEVEDFVSTRFPDLLEGDVLTLIGHVNRMQVAGQLLEEGRLLDDDDVDDIPLNVRLSAQDDDGFGGRIETQVIIEYSTQFADVIGQAIYIFRHDQPLSAADIDEQASNEFIERMSQYPDFLGGEPFLASVLAIIDSERAY